MDLVKKISNRSARVGVIGLGYVGLPLVIEFTLKNFSVTGFDVDQTKIDLLKEGKSYIKHIDISPLTNIAHLSSEASPLRRVESAKRIASKTRVVSSASNC